jgi:hypothetical protein
MCAAVAAGDPGGRVLTPPCAVGNGKMLAARRVLSRPLLRKGQGTRLCGAMPA